MALIKTDNTIISIHGRLGGIYFKTGPDGIHIQAMPCIVKYTRSPAQMGDYGEKASFINTGINGYSGSAVIWLAALTAFFAALWAIYALGAIFYGIGKEPKKISGFNWFIHYAMGFPECQRPPFWKPPHGINELPSFIVTYQGLYTYYHTPPEWPLHSPADYYWLGLTWNGKPTYYNDDQTWYLWWNGTNWVLSKGVDFEDEENTYYSPGESPVGFYQNPNTKKYINVYFGKPQIVKQYE